jgi:hypothetical protein
VLTGGGDDNVKGGDGRSQGGWSNVGGGDNLKGGDGRSQDGLIDAGGS